MQNKHFAQPHAHKFDNLDEMNQFLEVKSCQNSHEKK